jgi:hypothetical protein
LIEHGVSESTSINQFFSLALETVVNFILNRSTIGTLERGGVALVSAGG